MRIVRIVVGMLLLTIGLPALLVGGALWTAMQHRDGGGAFSGAIERITTPGHAVVVPDLDALLRRDAPFTRARDTRLRVTARTEAGPALVGIAPAADAARYLAGVPYAQVDRVSLTSGTLPVRVSPVAGAAAPATRPGWEKQGAGAVDWASSEVRGQRIALVVTHPDARAGLTVDLRIEVRPGWLGSATAGLLLLGVTLVVLGMGTLAWPARFAPASGPRPATLADLLPTPVRSSPAPPGSALPDSAPPGPAPPGPVEAAAPAQGLGLWDGKAAPVAPILAWPPHPRSTVTPKPIPAGPSRPDSASREDAGVPDSRHGGEDAGLPGSAGLAGALDALGTPSRPARRRRTAAGLPTDHLPR